MEMRRMGVRLGAQHLQPLLAPLVRTLVHAQQLQPASPTHLTPMEMLRMGVKRDVLLSPTVLALHAPLPLSVGALLFLVIQAKVMVTTMPPVVVKFHVLPLPVARALPVPLPLPVGALLSFATLTS
jgi:hypothetical protein